MTVLQRIREIFTPLPQTFNNKTTSQKDEKKRLASKLVKNQLLRQRIDIQNWTAALQSAESVIIPNRSRLMEIYEMTLLDATLSSQMSNRIESTIASDYALIDTGGKRNDKATTALRDSKFTEELMESILLSQYWGFSLVQLLPSTDGNWTVELIPRAHVEPQRGIVKLSSYDIDGIRFRELAEYGSTILSFGKPDDLGLLNKAVPHVIMKRFATSCWSEFCEIFGMPTRVVKTNTSDTVMLSRAEAMLRDMGSAPYLIIDETEDFEFVDAINTDGAVFQSFIRLCDQQLSLLISGAVIGQDTQHGNYSKEEASQNLTAKLIRADKRMVAANMNHSVLPALVSLGIIPSGLRFEWVDDEDLETLWERTVQAMPHYQVDAKWITNKFGIELKEKDF